MLKHSLLLFICVGWSIAQSDGAEGTQSNPCAAVSKLYQESIAETQVFIPAKLAQDCLTSVPINVPRATKLMKSLLAYSEWQSTLAYLKDPPSDYAYPSVDIIKELQNLTDSVESNLYTKEYEYASDVYSVVERSHDGHYTFAPDILLSAFKFVRTVQLVSVSMDGKELPQVYVLGDILSANGSNPSPVTSLDGKDIAAFLKDQVIQLCHDPDACYNSMFFHLNHISGSERGLGLFSISERYSGESTMLGFHNGTTIETPNQALAIGNLTGIDGPEAFYERFCSDSLPTESQGFQPVEKTSRLIPVDPYPEAVIIDEAESVAGYYIDEDGFEDVAVLYLPTFLSNAPVHQRIVEDFFKNCRKSGKTKLVLDLQGNLGGYRSEAYDVFNQIFPDIESKTKERMRAHESLDVIGQSMATIFANEDAVSSTNMSIFAKFAYWTSFNIFNKRPLDGDEFQSWDDYYGPVEEYGDTFTSYYEWKFNDSPSALVDGMALPTGYGNRTMGPSRAFEDVIILTDGMCGSTCSLIVNLLRERANVKSVTFGGRAEYGPMQTVGSTRGTHVYGALSILSAKEIIKEHMNEDEGAKLDIGKLEHLDDAVVNRSASSNMMLNMADNVRLDDETDTPLQFVYQAADCRLFFTPEMITDGTAAWKAAVRVMNGDYEACVRDSTKHPTSLTGSGNATIPADKSAGNGSFPLTKDDVNDGFRTAASTGLLFALPLALLMLV